MSNTERLNEIEARQNDLLEALRLAEERAHKAARAMYRRGYLAGHSAGRRGAKSVRGPYSKTRRVLGG